ncbi:MAG: CcmD family protein [Dehalococcoidia bacterium]
MSGITVVYIVFAIVIASIFGYTFLISQRQREIETEMDELKRIMAEKQDGR